MHYENMTARNIKLIITFIIAVMLLVLPAQVMADTFHYIHDPMENPKAAKDIVVDPDAVYGYAPSPDSDRLKEYVDYDWSDSEMVEEKRQEREAYHASIQELYDMIASMEAEGASIEDIARAVSNRRNELRLEAYANDPEGLAKVKKSNLEKYGNENGGTAEYYYEKYGSWEVILEKALSTNEGADACLGLYDKYYDTYIIDETTYTVQSGDSLMGIAEKLLGDKSLWETIYERNKDMIQDPNLIFPGQVLYVVE